MFHPRHDKHLRYRQPPTRAFVDLHSRVNGSVHSRFVSALFVVFSIAIFGCSRNRSESASDRGGSAGATSVAGAGGSNSGGGSGPAPCDRPSCPESLYSRPGNPVRGIEVDAIDLFWCEATPEEGLVVRAAPKSGAGPVRTLGSWYDFSAGRSLIVDDQYVYWLRPEGTGELLRVNKDGSNPLRIPLPAAEDGQSLQIGPLHDAGDAIIVGEHGCIHAVRVPKNGDPPALFRVSTNTTGGGVTGLESDASSIYCFNRQFLYRVDVANGQTGAVGEALTHPGGALLLIGRQLFVGNNNPTVGASGNLAVVDLDAVAALDLGSSQGQVARIHYDERRRTLHWVTGLSRMVGKVVEYDLDGILPPEALFENQDVMGNSAADDDYLYWLSNTAVTRLKK